MSEAYRILITCVGGTMVPAALGWLKSNSRIPLTLFGVDGKDAPVSAAMLDSFRTVPMGDHPDYIPTMLGMVRDHAIQVVVPWSDGEAYALADAAAQFEALGASIMTSPADVLNQLRDKLATYRTVVAAGLPVPDHAIITDVAALKVQLETYGYPERSVIVKPATGRGGRNLFVLEGDDALPSWLGSGQRESRLSAEEFQATDPASLIEGATLVMPCLQAPVFDADILATKGRVHTVVIRQRNNPTGIPWTGNAVCRNKAFEDYARAVAEALKLDGPHDMDLMSDADGRPALLEVNPRMSGSLSATLAAGIPFLDAAIALRLGIELPVPLPDRDVQVLPYTEAQAL